MASKEKILDGFKQTHDYLTEESGYRTEDTLSAMDEYAQQKSEEFLKWVYDNKFVPNSSGLWFDAKLSRDEVRFYDIAKLYKWFDTGVKYVCPPLILPKSIEQ